MTKRAGTVKIVSEQQLAQSLAERLSDDILDENRRHDTRLPAEFEVEVPLSWDQLKQAYTMNISKGGLTFSIDPPASIPSALDLTITLPDGTSVTLSSEVRHISPCANGGFDVGVQFKKLDDETKQTISAALSQLKH